MTVAVIVPTIRPQLFADEFLPAWNEQFSKHKVHLFYVVDGEKPEVRYLDFSSSKQPTQIEMNGLPSCVYNFTDAVRNLGFLAAHKLIEPDIYISLDDDVLPEGDTIGDHIKALTIYVSTEWMNTATDYRMRGLPYNLRKRRVMLSHGTWSGVPDFDAIQQLQNPDVRDVDTPKMIVPKLVYFPVCAMNMAFAKELLPYIYQAPMGKRLVEDGLPVYDRFADIWGGVTAKYALDYFLDGVAVSGYAKVHHKRASKVFVNLRKEAIGMELNETFYQQVHVLFNPDMLTGHDYLDLYRKRLMEWHGELKYTQNITYA